MILIHYIIIDRDLSKVKLICKKKFKIKELAKYLKDWDLDIEVFKSK